ncbi:MAG: T9SS type A sorting domain-containing protein [Candidatus Marinimicrobia bacterium]|nr:T9SS type A sorting domain-containing protein [Candidatus Neomarinimicrobiota bacterium]
MRKLGVSYKNITDEIPRCLRRGGSFCNAPQQSKSTIGGLTFAIDPVPMEFKLHPVYPNPFNITTTLKLDLPEETRFSLVIYDIQGSEIWRLNNRRSNTYPAGYHRIVWNGCDNSGAVVPTGVYFIVYHSPEHRLSQKLVLMK